MPITSGKLAKDMIGLVENSKKINHLVLFCGNKKKCQGLLDKQIVLALEDRFEELLKVLPEVISEIEYVKER